jgi:hypothetical protein
MNRKLKQKEIDMSQATTPIWQQHPIYTREDGSYVIHMPHPYHVPNDGEFLELWSAVTAYLTETGITPEPEPLPPPPPPPTQEEQLEELARRVQNRLDQFAQTRGYDGILAAATYATSTDAAYAAEGQYAVQARDDTWGAWFALENAVIAGDRTMPAWEDVEAELPVLAWPEV